MLSGKKIVMLAVSPKTVLWREIQRQNFTKLNDLADYLALDQQKRFFLCQTPSFPLYVPRRIAAKMAKNDLQDPILKQFLPTIYEETSSDGFALDPVADHCFQKEKKLLQKYPGRALLLTTSACAMHCRFCFRQNFPYERQRHGFEEELQLISEDDSLSEIILSGGDPLSLDDRILSSLMHDLDSIAHIKRIRFHTRFPIGIPERIDQNFLEILAASSKQIIFIIHANHFSEFDEDIFAALKEIQKLAIPVLCQTVLLKGINDDYETLKTLFEGIVDRGILPYYLHQLDRVRGSAHFEADEGKMKELIVNLRENLSGYAVPQYVRENPGEKSKTPLI